MIKRPWWQVALVVCGLAALALFSASIGMRWVIKSTEIAVPDLTGKNVVEALELLNNLDLRLDTEEQDFHPEIPANHIISQRPAADSLVKSGRKIKVVISRGAQLVDMPNLVGKSWYQVQTGLRKNGLIVGVVSKVHALEPAQQVLSQSPLAGIAIKRGSKVNLLLSQGQLSDFYVMPDFIGQDLNLVRRHVKRMNMSLGTVKYKVYQGLKPEVVINQAPPAGFRIRQGKLVNLVVSKS